MIKQILRKLGNKVRGGCAKEFEVVLFNRANKAMMYLQARSQRQYRGKINAWYDLPMAAKIWKMDAKFVEK